MTVNDPTTSAGSGSATTLLVRDAVAAVVAVAATVAATSWAGKIVSGTDLTTLYGLLLGYVFGRGTSA